MSPSFITNATLFPHNLIGSSEAVVLSSIVFNRCSLCQKHLHHTEKRQVSVYSRALCRNHIRAGYNSSLFYAIFTHSSIVECLKKNNRYIDTPTALVEPRSRFRACSRTTSAVLEAGWKHPESILISSNGGRQESRPNLTRNKNREYADHDSPKKSKISWTNKNTGPGLYGKHRPRTPNRSGLSSFAKMCDEFGPVNY